MLQNYEKQHYLTENPQNPQNSHKLILIFIHDESIPVFIQDLKSSFYLPRFFDTTGGDDFLLINPSIFLFFHPFN